MNAHYIRRFEVNGLWGHKNYSIAFTPDVNVIIGPNASGKTTLLNILYDSLHGNLPRLLQTDFSKVIVQLHPFDSDRPRQLTLSRSQTKLRIKIDDKEYAIPSAPFVQIDDDFDYSQARLRRFLLNRNPTEITLIQKTLRELVPAVWLPVSRRLPIADDDDSERPRLHTKTRESVDECLADLVAGLQKYRLSLNAELSELRREFQLHALENILYDKQHDKGLGRRVSFIPPSEHDKDSLLRAFQDVGLANPKIEARINDHFDAASVAYSKLKSGNLDMESVFIIPLINRTRSIVEFAQELENSRSSLFAALRNFEDIVNSFINDKSISVSDQGELVIKPLRENAANINWRHLSSGEKQILILLTQALLSERAPVVYVADEPELSLHVTWQGKLLNALTALAGRCQFIVATHSPDIVSDFGEKVIDLSRQQS